MSAMSSMDDEAEDNLQRPPGEVVDEELKETMCALCFERCRGLCARYGG